MNQEFMKEKPVMPLVISMAPPMTFSMLVNALYNIIDSYFVAQISEDAMTALSLVFPLQNLVNAVVIGFAIGINATMAYYLGAQKQQLADKTASLGMLLNMLHGRCWRHLYCSYAGLFRDVYKTGRNYRNGGDSTRILYFYLQCQMRRRFVLKKYFRQLDA